MFASRASSMMLGATLKDESPEEEEVTAFFVVMREVGVSNKKKDQQLLSCHTFWNRTLPYNFRKT